MNEEVMDWLTEEWTRKVAEKAHDKWTYLYHERKEPCIERQYVADFIARAAVKKVAEWLEEDCTEHTPPLYAATYPVDRASCAECWAILKAAGGEG